MSGAAQSQAGWAIAGVSGGVVGFWLVFGGMRDAQLHGSADFVVNVYPNIVFGLTFPAVGAMILSRLSAHRLGRLYCLCGLASAITLAVFSYARQGLITRPGSLPGAAAAGWVSSWIWLCGVAPLVTLGVLWFPDGRLPSRGWWPVAAAAGVFIGVGVLSTGLRPGPLENHPVRDNPVGVPLPRSWFTVVDNAALLPLLFAAIVGSLGAVILRYRRGSPAVRSQVRWFAVAVALVVASTALADAGRTAGVERLLPALVTVPLLPLSVGVAVLSGRLYGAETAARRSLVYGWLLAAGLAVYAAVVLALDTVLRGHAQPAITLVAAGSVAVLYQPIRLRLERSVNRMLYGERGDPYAVLTRLGRRLEQAGSAERTLPDTVETIATALRLPYVAVHLRGDPPDRPTAVHGNPPGIQPLQVQLSHGGDSVGDLVIGRRDARDALNAAEVRLLEDLGRQVAVAAHAVLLERALRRSRERLIAATAEERQRLRRELHDGLGPALAGVALGVDAARNILRSDPQAADTLLEDLKHETLDSVAEIRRIVDDLRPGALNELGLLPALSAFVERVCSREARLQVVLHAPDSLPALPAAVEAAAYRIAVEAITNVTRHAGARSCRVRVNIDGLAEELTVEVCDDGIGLPSAPTPGVGLGSMTARATELGGSCVAVGLDHGGTRVFAHLPLAIA